MHGFGFIYTNSDPWRHEPWRRINTDFIFLRAFSVSVAKQKWFGEMNQGVDAPNIAGP
jgi:hypothetical protein